MRNPGSSAIAFDSERFLDSLKPGMDHLANTIADGGKEALDAFLESARQPSLLKMMVAWVFMQATEGPKELRIQMETVPVFLMVLRSLVDELDRAAREEA